MYSCKDTTGKSCNSIREGTTIPEDVNSNPTSNRLVREAFIRDKYENKSFLMPLPARYAADPTSSLYYAIADGNYQLIMHLLAYVTRADLNRPIGSEQQTPLHVASSIGDLASVQLLLWMKANPCLINIEDSFVNFQELTLSTFVPEFRLGILGSVNSGKSALVHRFLTGTYVREESLEGGRFKKEMAVDGQSHLLLVRDEGGPPEEKFSSWVDGIIFVFNLADKASYISIYNYYGRLVHYRNVSTLPLVLVGTQDYISPEQPRVIFEDRAKKLAGDLKRCVYYETCSTYGLNVDRVFQDLAQKIFFVKRRFDLSSNNTSPNIL